MENILFIKRVRKKNKSFWDFFSTYFYYENEKISFKEKVYTFLYNLNKTGSTTQGEANWSERMLQIHPLTYVEISAQFYLDYVEFEMKDKKLAINQ